MVVWGPLPTTDETVRVPAEIVGGRSRSKADDHPVTLDA
jgi:hypothetical protein